MALQSPLQCPENCPKTGKKPIKTPVFCHFLTSSPQSLPNLLTSKMTLFPPDCNGEQSVAMNAKYQGIGNSDAPILLFTLPANFS